MDKVRDETNDNERSGKGRQEPEHWGWVVGLGILLIAFGGVGVSLSLTVGTILPAGWFLLGSGFLQALHALSVQPHRSFPLDVLTSAFYVVIGLVIVLGPPVDSQELAVLIGAIFMVQGAFRIIIAMVEPLVGRISVFASGVVSLYLGFHLWAGWSFEGLMPVALFIGIEILITGWSFLGRGFGERRLSEAGATPSPDERYP